MGPHRFFSTSKRGEVKGGAFWKFNGSREKDENKTGMYGWDRLRSSECTRALWPMVVTECTEQPKSSNKADVFSPLERQLKEGEPRHNRLVDR
jgi:hypothetical protein